MTAHPKEQLWTVARFPNGCWSTGGHPNDSDYSKCETWQILASSRDEAKKKAQALRARDQRKRRAAQRKHGATP